VNEDQQLPKAREASYVQKKAWLWCGSFWNNITIFTIVITENLWSSRTITMPCSHWHQPTHWVRVPLPLHSKLLLQDLFISDSFKIWYLRGFFLGGGIYILVHPQDGGSLWYPAGIITWKTTKTW
jgi:hypothetical protein